MFGTAEENRRGIYGLRLLTKKFIQNPVIVPGPFVEDCAQKRIEIEANIRRIDEALDIFHRLTKYSIEMING